MGTGTGNHLEIIGPFLDSINYRAPIAINYRDLSHYTPNYRFGSVATRIPTKTNSGKEEPMPAEYDLKTAQEILSNITPAYVEAMTKVAEALEAFSLVPRNLCSGGATDSTRRILGAFVRSFPYQRFEAATTRLAEMGWTLPMNLDVVSLQSLADTETETDIAAWFIEFYEGNDGQALLCLFDRIQKSTNLVRWKSLIHECIQGYQSQMYVVPVPALISVIEGVVQHHRGRLQSKNTHVIEPCKEMMSAVSEQSVQYLMWRSIWKFVEALFQPCSFDGPRPQELNRHWILHGRAESDWGKIDCLKLINAVCTLS